jgi:uncharacterized protein (DUF433 family)
MGSSEPRLTAGLIHDRGRGPEIRGTRVTVYHLLPEFLDPAATEAYICRIFQLTPEQVAAARAYILNHPDAVLAEHLKIEEKLAAGNRPEIVEKAKEIRGTLLKFKEWLAQREQGDAQDSRAAVASENGGGGSHLVPTFREWLGGQEAGRESGS